MSQKTNREDWGFPWGRAVFLVLLAALAGRAVAEADYASPIALSLAPDGQHLFVAEETGQAVAEIDLVSQEIVRRFDVAGTVGGVTVAGNRLYVAHGRADGHVEVFDLGSGQSLESMAVGHTPMSPCVTADGQWLVMANRYSNTLGLKSLTTPGQWIEIDMPREPVAVALTPDGTMAVVANHLQAGRSDQNFVAADVTLVDITTQTKIADLPLPNGSSGLRGVCIEPGGEFAYVTHLVARYQIPTTQVDRGWMNTNALSIINLQSRSLLATVLLDDVDMGAANPWGVSCSDDGALLMVSLAGTHELCLIDRLALHEKIRRAPRRYEYVNDLNFLHGVRQRVPLSGEGPRGAAVMAGGNIYVGLYFADVVDVVSYSPSLGGYLEDSIPLGPPLMLTQIRLGEMRFNDGNACFQKWQTCASCHPDGYMDAMNWDLLNDGVGNHKNAKSLLLSHDTPPVMSSGIRPNAETAVRAGMRYIQFVAIDEVDANALDAYLKAQEPIPSPYLVDGQLSAAAQRGKSLFQVSGCASCHSGPYLTDMKSHAVGTGLGREVDWSWDTPTLINVWKTAPYLHDGRVVTIREVLTTENPHDRRGVTSSLTEEEIDDLVEYILSL